MWHVGCGALTRGQTQAPLHWGALSLSHWTTVEVPPADRFRASVSSQMCCEQVYEVWLAPGALSEAPRGGGHSVLPTGARSSDRPRLILPCGVGASHLGWGLACAGVSEVALAGWNEKEGRGDFQPCAVSFVLQIQTSLLFFPLRNPFPATYAKMSSLQLVTC